jgi:hypothetical protein
VKILFDNNTPAGLAKFLQGHDVTRAAQVGWQTYRNGEWLNAAEKAGYALLITCDQNLPYQQNLDGRSIALIIIASNYWPTVRQSASRIAIAVDFIQRGQVVRIEIS